MYPASSAGIADTVAEMVVAQSLSRVLTSRSIASLATDDLRRVYKVASPFGFLSMDDSSLRNKIQLF